jgi:hypothetical protein
MGFKWEDFLVKEKSFEGLKNRIFLLGPPGSGKTRFIGTCPNPIIINTEGGTLTLAGKKIPEIVFNKDRTRDIMKNMIQIVRSAQKREGIFENIETFAIDSIAQLAKFYMYDIMLYQVSPSKDPLVDKPNYDHWGRLKNNLENLVMELQALSEGGMHVVCTCGVSTEVEEATGKYINVPLMDGKIRYIIPYGFDDVLGMDAKTFGKATKYVAYTRNVGNYIGLKSRSDAGFELEDPTFEKVREALEAIKAKLNQGETK